MRTHEFMYDYNQGTRKTGLCNDNCNLLFGRKQIDGGTDLTAQPWHGMTGAADQSVGVSNVKTSGWQALQIKVTVAKQNKIQLSYVDNS